MNQLPLVAGVMAGDQVGKQAAIERFDAQNHALLAGLAGHGDFQEAAFAGRIEIQREFAGEGRSARKRRRTNADMTSGGGKNTAGGTVRTSVMS